MGSSRNARRRHRRTIPSGPGARNVRYETLLKTMETSHPRLAPILLAAARNRTARLRMYHKGLRLRGLDELLLYLDRVEESFKTHPELEKVRTLVWRARGDFEVSTEAALSAMPAVVLDFMRDVMEIELLLRDFASEPARIDEWI